MGRDRLFERLAALERELAEIRARLGTEAQVPPPAQASSLDAATSQLIVEYASDCISIHELDGRYLFASGAFTTYFGWRQEDLIGRSPYELFHPDDVPRIAADHSAYADTEAGHTRRIAYRLRCADGSYRWVETRWKTYVTDEGLQRILCFTRDLSDLIEELNRLRRRVMDLDELSSRDHLTGLANRRQLEARLDELIKESRRGRRFVLAMIDVDYFKRINDTYGHGRGDAALNAVARALAQTCREVDLVARFGGEEFCTVFVDARIDQATGLAERQRGAVESLDLDTPLTISIGLAEHTPGTDIDTLLAQADRALYEAKSRGRNRIAVAG